MSTQQYTQTASTRVTRDMGAYIDNKATQLGLTRAQTLREIIEFYQHVHEQGCPGCGCRLSIKL